MAEGEGHAVEGNTSKEHQTRLLINKDPLLKRMLCPLTPERLMQEDHFIPTPPPASASCLHRR